MAKDKSEMNMQNGQVITDEDGKQYFVCGKNYIEIAEHFAQAGKSLGDLIEDVMKTISVTAYTINRPISLSRIKRKSVSQRKNGTEWKIPMKQLFPRVCFCRYRSR